MVALEAAKFFTPTPRKNSIASMYYTHLLRSRRDKMFYIGSTNDLRRRFQEHNSGAERDARHREHNLKLRANAFYQLKSRIQYSLIAP